jgi:hypothetical protein
MSSRKFDAWRKAQMLLESDGRCSVVTLWRYAIWVPAKELGIRIQIFAVLLRPSERVLEMPSNAD